MISANIMTNSHKHHSKNYSRNNAFKYQSYCKQQNIIYYRRKCNLNSILKSSLHYIEYHLTSGEVLRVRQKITDAEKELNSYGFAKIHRQYIVNLNAIERIRTTNSFLRLHSGKTLNISKTYLDTVMSQYQQQMRNMP